MVTTKIEKGIPVPADRPRPVLPLDALDVGDSFLFDPQFRRNFYYHAQLLKPRRFMTRTVIENNVRRIRVWRIA